MFSILMESAVRNLALGIVVWIALRIFRVRSTQNRSLAWTGVLLASVTMPVLMKTMSSVVAIAPPAAVAWIPTVPAASPTLPAMTVLTPAAPVARSASIDAATIAVVVYVAVTGILLLRLLIGLSRGLWLVRMAVPLKSAWTAGLHVRVSRNLAVPVTYGSTILLPAEWPEWSTFKRDSVLLHEQSHVRRGDFYIHLLAEVHRALLWFSPMAWWLQRELLRLAELSCDDAAIRKVEDRVSYAEILVEFAGKGSASGFAGAPMASGRTVEHRVERMLGEHAIPGQSSPRSRIGVVAVLVPLVLVAAGSWQMRASTALVLPPIARESVLTPAAQTQTPSPARPAPTAPAVIPAQQPAQTAPVSGLAGWPDNEVPYIISPEEKNAFLRLQTDVEREQFINQFWLRRDPTPGTVENEYRDEYYRRIVVANQRFTPPSGPPGWRTDRGRIFIMHGPADEIETHAQGGTYLRAIEEGGGKTNTFPFERWRYRYIEGLGNNIILEFVDSMKDGNHRLEFDPTAVNKLLQQLQLPAAPRQ